MNFEQYLQEFTNSINPADFFVNLIVTGVLTIILKYFYIRFGNSLSEKRKFADNFILLSLTTMLIITIVKSSIALSLGLVGALSIVRFRTAIKNPEELTYLFLAIAVGLACGASQTLIAIIGFFFILVIILINKLLGGKSLRQKDNRMFLNIKTDVQDLKKITDHVSTHFKYVELRRMDKSGNEMHYTFLFNSDSVDDIESLKNDLISLSQNIDISIVGEPDLIA